MILELGIAALIIALYVIFIGGLFLSRLILKDGRRWKDPIVISLGIAVLMITVGGITLLTYIILEAF